MKSGFGHLDTGLEGFLILRFGGLAHSVDLLIDHFLSDLSANDLLGLLRHLLDLLGSDLLWHLE